MKDNNMNLVEEINQAEYLQEICKASPQITIGTQCGIGMYQFKSIGYRDNELVLEFKLIMDSKRTDSDKIAYNIGERCILTAAQYLYAYEYNAFA
tara:strand:+ start:356 stop:640 length:285 start_codon:yes stop_codon:yes gene_type:complete